MKPKHLLLLIACILICFEIGNAQMRMSSPDPELINGYPQEFWDWWEQVWADYMAKKRAWEMGYLQDWNENMQKGIKRLNTMPQQVGVTPINGALVLNETDISIPGRLGNISVTRYYNSKIWYADTSDVNLSLAFHVGMGWDLHFGRLRMRDSCSRILETPNGGLIYFKKPTLQSSTYISTDGSFMKLEGDDEGTIKTGDGTQLIFDFQGDNHQTGAYYLTKIIAPNGNITRLFYDDYYWVLDSIITSTNEKLTFHYHEG
ncbi:hypothetical protein GQ543_10385 [candidate division WOR-3 bacterium]|nr:hypothetical protein [candidate division WOR-3 bacterium]